MVCEILIYAVYLLTACGAAASHLDRCVSSNLKHLNHVTQPCTERTSGPFDRSNSDAAFNASIAKYKGEPNTIMLSGNTTAPSLCCLCFVNPLPLPELRVV